MTQPSVAPPDAADRYERLIAAAVEAADRLPVDAEQRDRYRSALEVAREHRGSVFTILPAINGRLAARAGQPRRVLADGPYERGYTWPPRKVFTCSWSDWFHKDADRWRDEAWDVIRRTPQHTYLVLTKRPERIADHLPDDWGDGWPNVWLGVSIENRQFVHRADVLRAVPAAVRFISAEPLLGPLVCETCGGLGWDVEPDESGKPVQIYCPGCTPYGPPLDRPELDLRGIDWLIAGGESGSRPGRMLVERDDAGRWVPKPDALRWVRDLRDACERAETAFLFKQWGGPRPTSGGRLLDGRTWDEMPATRPVEVER